VALAPFFPRVSDAIRSVVDIPYERLDELAADTIVSVRFAEHGSDNFLAGARLLVNLLARLYPQLELEGPGELVDTCALLAESVNPLIDLAPRTGRRIQIGFGCDGADDAVTVSAAGWTVYVDCLPHTTTATAPFADLAAACFAAAEAFRAAFADVLGAQARKGSQPGVFDLVTGGTTPSTGPTDLAVVRLPDMHLAGAGAIGQAAVLALQATGGHGGITLVDAERLELSNLQRYVLSTIDDVGALKVELAASVLRPAGWDCAAVPTIWGADEHSGPRQDTVLVALDTERDRLGVAAGLHRRVYNAWTQPADLGWSRHENFGPEPCLACLYYPDSVTPSEDEQVAAALRQHRLRILSYFATNQPVGLPLRGVSPVADMPPPPEAQEWLAVPLLTDLVAAGIINVEQAPEWASRTIGELYVDGLCGGGLVRLDVGELSREVAVPLAHQSALAGVMLAAQPFLAAISELRGQRPATVENRLDLLTGFPQVVPRPRARTAGCICSDPVYSL
jgi:hypothetical protein